MINNKDETAGMVADIYIRDFRYEERAVKIKSFSMSFLKIKKTWNIK